jgi:hypothetical protein
MKRLWWCFCVLAALCCFGIGCGQTADESTETEAEMEEDIQDQADMMGDEGLPK